MLHPWLIDVHHMLLYYAGTKVDCMVSFIPAQDLTTKLAVQHWVTCKRSEGEINQNHTPPSMEPFRLTHTCATSTCAHIEREALA